MTQTTQRFGLRSLLLAASVLVALTLAFTQVSAASQTPTAQRGAAPERPTQAQNPTPVTVIGELVLNVGSEAITVPVYAFSYGASQSGTTHVGGGGGAGKANFQDISLTIAAGTYSPALLGYVATGAHIDSAFLDVPFPDGTPATYEFTNVLVSSISEGGSGGGPRTENITLNHQVVTKAIGGASFSWDIAENATP